MFQIRQASFADIPTIQSLAQDIWPKAYGQMISADQLNYMLGWMYGEVSLTRQLQEGHQFILLEENSRVPCGYASYRLLNNTDWKLEKLYVQVEKHGEGLGKTLLQNIMDRIREQGGKQLELKVNRSNPAVGFYQRMGFQILREENFDIGNGYFMNDYVMASPL